MALTIGPRSGSQLGGAAVYVSGPCFNENDIINCFFDDDRESRLRGYYVSNSTAICISPRFDTPGWKTLYVEIRSGQLLTTGRSRFYAGKHQ